MHLLQGLDARVYRVCDEPRSVEAIADRLGEPEAPVRAAIDRLIEARLLVDEGGRCLSLAVFRVRRDRPPATMPLAEPRVVAGR